MIERQAMPEWLTRDDLDPEPWEVVAGAAVRGQAFTDLVARRMAVPFGDDETSRCIRAHELMHAKVSPVRVSVPDEYAHLDNELLIVAEEFRVNMLCGAAGFPVLQQLHDGSEKLTGTRLAHNGDWNALVHMTAATSGTKAFSGLIAGVRSANEAWVPTLKELDRQLRRLWRARTKHGLTRVASTELWGRPSQKLPIGWQFTIEAAQLISRALITTSAEGEVPPDPEAIGTAKRRKMARFAKLVELDTVKPNRVDGRLGRRKRPTNIGRHPRHLDRLLTDPERRVFDRKLRGKGGVVLIDQSGSMRLADGDLWRIIDAAPGCVIIGYSHAAGTEGKPNIWVLADRGRVVDSVPAGHGGNGVDGPAISFALRRRRPGEPMVWVCDGYVTDENDDQHASLTDECARLVGTHRIHMVPTVDAAVGALTRAAHGERLPASAVGPIATCRAWGARR